MSVDTGLAEQLDTAALLDVLRGSRQAFVAFLTSLAELESPTPDVESQAPVQRILTDALSELDFDVQHLPGRTTGGHLYARPRQRVKGAPGQLLIGHTDTVWPVGTLRHMPVHVADGRLYGPGTFDMKAGLTMIVFALRALRALRAEPSVAPVIFINSDEETGSPDSERWVRILSRRVCRALVLEPALGLDGKIKTARKGVGQFEVIAKGKASHAGLAPEEGASATHELAHVILELAALNDPQAGTTVSAGVIEGGTRSNVIAASARADIDVRVMSSEAGRHLEEAVAKIRSHVPGVELTIEGGIRVPPLERTPRNRLLWEQVRSVGGALGFDLEEGMSGGGSDGNVTSLFTATVDGLGAIGDGAHAVHEHIVIDATLERTAVLAGLLMAPAAEG